MHRRILCSSAAAIASFAIALVPSLTASAHFVFSAGAYRVAIGWQFEPASGSVTYVGQTNAVQVFIDKPDAGSDIGTPVGDLNADCSHPDIQVTVAFGSTTSSPMCPQPVYDADTARGRQDEYDAVVIPTKVGDYTFHIFGSIHGTPVDQHITSGPMTFDSVGDQSSVEFPVAVPALGEVAAKADQVNSRAADALSTARSSSSSAGTATTIAVIALVVAVVVSGLNVLVALRRRRS